MAKNETPALDYILSHYKSPDLVQSAQKEIKNLKSQVSTFKTKYKKLRSEIQQNKELVCRAREVLQSIMDVGDFMDASEHMCM